MFFVSVQTSAAMAMGDIVGFLGVGTVLDRP